MGVPEGNGFQGLHTDISYISLLEKLSSRRRALAEWGRCHLGMVWQYIVEPAWVQFVAIREAKKQDIEVVFFTEIEPLSLLPILLLLGGRKIQPVVGTMTCMYSMKSSLKGMPFYTRIRSMLNRHALRLLPRLSHISCDCVYSAEQAGIPEGPTLHIVPEGLRSREQTVTSQQDARNKLGIPLDRRMLMLFGVASPAKGADLLLQALETVPPSFDLYIVGKTGDQYLKTWGNTERLNTLGWQGRLHIVSRFVTDEERDAYFAACDAVVMPYRYGFPCISGVLTQAIEHGKAALVSDQFEIGRVVRTYNLGLLFPPDNGIALSQSLLNFSGKSAEWFAEIANNCRKMVADFSCEQIGVKYRRLFEHVATITPKLQRP